MSERISDAVTLGELRSLMSLAKQTPIRGRIPDMVSLEITPKRIKLRCIFLLDILRESTTGTGFCSAFVEDWPVVLSEMDWHYPDEKGSPV